MSERKLATIRRIDKIEPIEGADKIVKATIGGWALVTAIDNGFKEGDLVCYIEIDSWVPTELASFLSKGKEPREFNGVKGEKLRTIKLRGQVSQGLILPFNIISQVVYEYIVNANGPDVMVNVQLKEGDDVTTELNIQKWEMPMNAQLAGMAKGNFPSFIPKTDQERIQNLSKELKEYDERGLSFEVSEKLEGSSMTVYFNNGEFGVCSRNIDLKETEGNSFWNIARKLKLEAFMLANGKNIALQAELIGPGIQGNIYNLTEHQFRLFDVFNIDTQEYWPAHERYKAAVYFDVEQSPVLAKMQLLGRTIEQMLELAEGESVLFKTEREGVVFKCIEDPSISFKIISNKYLIKQDK